MKLNLQQGSALIVALVFLLAMTLIGVAAMRDTTQQESMAGNVKQRNLAFQAAEAGIRAGEKYLEDNDPAFVDWGSSCTGYCKAPTDTTTLSKSIVELWMDYCWIISTGCTTAGSKEYTGGLTAISAELSAKPRYVIEDLGKKLVEGYDLEQGTPPVYYKPYRITARGLGGAADAVVILQTTYRKE